MNLGIRRGKVFGVALLILASAIFIILVSAFCLTPRCSAECTNEVSYFVEYANNFTKTVDMGFIFLSPPAIEWIDSASLPPSYQNGVRMILNAHWIKHLNQDQFSWILFHELAHRILNHYPTRNLGPNQELKADVLATLLLYRNGFDPKEGPRALSNLNLGDAFDQDSFAPDSAHRIRNIRNYLPHLFGTIPPSQENLDVIVAEGESQCSQIFCVSMREFCDIRTSGQAHRGLGQLYVINIRSDYQAALKSTNELAFLVFHEIGHLNLYHLPLLARSQAVSIETKHNMEFAADIEAVKLMMKYGYHYQGAFDFLGKIDKKDTDTHPNRQSRIEHIQQYLESLKPHI